MKRILLLIAVTVIAGVTVHAQGDYTQQMQSGLAKLDNAKAVKDYQLLANDFLRIADAQKTQWLPYYYAAFCNAKIGWLKQNDDPDNIEPFANKAAEEIKMAVALIDTAKQKKQLAEIYCIYMMLNQARVFIRKPMDASMGLQHLITYKWLNRQMPIMRVYFTCWAGKNMQRQKCGVAIKRWQNSY